MGTWWRSWRATFALLLVAATVGYLWPARPSPPPERVVLADGEPVELQPLPAGTAWDYQIGGPRHFEAEVGIVVRDRLDPTAGVYDVCYINAFQTQAAELKFWRHESRRDLLLRNAGEPVMDGAWDEQLLDTRS